MKLYNALALTLVTHTLSIWSQPFVAPYDFNNKQQSEATIKLYKNVKGETAEIPSVLTEKPFAPYLPHASILFDEKKAIIGIIIHSAAGACSSSDKNSLHIAEFIIDPKYSSKKAKEFFAIFEKQKIDERFTQLTTQVQNSKEKSFFKDLDFVEGKDPQGKSTNCMRKMLVTPSTAAPLGTKK